VQGGGPVHLGGVDVGLGGNQGTDSRLVMFLGGVRDGALSRGFAASQCDGEEKQNGKKSGSHIKKSYPMEGRL
jgi:hypothetical protein